MFCKTAVWCQDERKKFDKMDFECLHNNLSKCSQCLEEIDKKPTYELKNLHYNVAEKTLEILFWKILDNGNFIK